MTTGAATLVERAETKSYGVDGRKGICLFLSSGFAADCPKRSVVFFLFYERTVVSFCYFTFDVL